MNLLSDVDLDFRFVGFGDATVMRCAAVKLKGVWVSARHYEPESFVLLTSGIYSINISTHRYRK